MLQEKDIINIILNHKKLRNLDYKLFGQWVKKANKSDVITVKEHFNGKVKQYYVESIVTGYYFATSTRHYKSNTLLWDDLLAGKRIYINSYS